MVTTGNKLVIFNVNQLNVARCIKEKQTGLRRAVPSDLKRGLLCLLRQTSFGGNPKNYGVVGVYRIIKVEKHDPSKPIQDWTPKVGWSTIVQLKELLVLPSVFREDFSLPTQVLRHKRSKYVKDLVNKDIQGACRIIDEPIATNYIQAIEDRYPQLAKILSDEDWEQRQREARKLTDEELKARLSKPREHASRYSGVRSGYIRDENVAEFVKRRARGICDLCEKEAPFRDLEGEPYLEEHHIHWLSKGGKDTTDNAVALCPNCHRKMHILDLETDREKLRLVARKAR